MASERTNPAGNMNNTARMEKMGGWVAVSAAYALMVLLLMYPDTVKGAAQSAMEQWYRNVVPALFPFMMLMPLITGREAAYIYEKMFGRLMGKLLCLPGGAVPAIVAGAVAGSPAGVIAAGKAAEASGMSKKQLLRVAGCMSGFSPAFLISGIGAGMMHSISSGVMLLKTQLIMQCIMLISTRRYSGGEKICPEPCQENAAGAAVIPILSVAGYMVFFSAISSLIGRFIGNSAANGIICILEVTQGAAYIAQAGLKYEFSMLLLASMCGFGGISIFAQNVKILVRYGVSPLDFLKWRLTGAAVSVMVMLVLLHFDGVGRAIICPDWLSSATLCVVILVIPAIIGLKRPIS